MNNNFLIVIKSIRFPLIIGVILIHSVIIKSDEAINMGYSILGYSTKLMCEILPQFCVPMFFAISGYLFFYNLDKFSTRQYLNKIKRRFHTLFIPYLFWNLVVAICYIISNQLFGRFEDLTKYSLIEWFDVFYSKFGGFPIAYQLWYLRDLIVLCIFAPLIYLTIRYGKYYSIILLFLVMISQIEFPKIVPIFYFSLGALFSIHNLEVERYAKRCFKYALLTSLISLSLLIFYIRNPVTSLLNVIYSISMFILIIYLASSLIKKNYIHRIGANLSKYSFFIYCYHGFPIVVICTIILQSSNIIFGEDCSIFKDLTLTLSIPIVVTLIILGGIYIYKILSRFFPNFTAFINGKR